MDELTLTYNAEKMELTIYPIDSSRFHNITEVVRCKDCIGKAHWYKNDYGCTICGLSGLFVVEDRDFCSYGERREGE